MELKQEKIDALRKLIATPGRRIAVVSHVNPDGDAIGSGLAWNGLLNKLGHQSRFFVPNAPPQFLEVIDKHNEIRSFKNRGAEYAEFISDCDVIFCLDLNNTARIEELGEAVRENLMATRVLIDHHCEPQPEYDLMFSYPESSSTAFLVYKIIEALGMTDLIDETMATQIYTGIMTDTGNFSYGNLTPNLFCSVAKLMEKGINIPVINSSVFNNHSEKRMRLLGYMLNQKMVTIDRHNAAYLTLNKEEMAEYEFQPGDSEGFVNYPLSIKHIRMSAFFMQTLSCIKVSLRSQGDIDVNKFARQYFNGGGHKNAAGGKSFYSMEKTVEHFLAALDEFFGSQNQ